MNTFFALALSLCAGGVIGRAASSQPETPPPLSEASSIDAAVLGRFLQSGAPPLQTYRAHRTLEASTMGGKLKASLEAWTSLDPNGFFHFDVIRQDGSTLIGKHVLLKALETEQRTHNQHEASLAELTPANYAFQVDVVADDETVKISLSPRRASPMLLNGTVIVRYVTGMSCGSRAAFPKGRRGGHDV